MTEPAEVAAALERGGQVQAGPGDRFTGYAVLGVSFMSGDVLALRRFPIRSSGPGYTSVWHCSPSGRWTFYTDVAGHGCAEYFGPALDEVVVTPIRIEWNGPRRVSIAVDGGRRLVWSMLMRSTPLTRAFNAVGPWLAPIAAKHPRLLTPLALVARLLFDTGPLRLVGRAPNGAGFAGTPWAVWIVRSSRACIDGHDTGPDRRLDRSLALGDFLIPRRGVFAAEHAAMSGTVTPSAAQVQP
ncbi:MAG TPA: hypothetical protein VMO26_00915 [Vicinamibacterales bacterium]|nr:hypothetical protein [Vicinamibacterales bacterium]